MNKYQHYFELVMRFVFGLAIIFFCGDMAHDEFVKPVAERSLTLLAAFSIAVVFGALLVPVLGPAVEDNGKRTLRLIAMGRRAYDAKVVVDDLELPPPSSQENPHG